MQVCAPGTSCSLVLWVWCFVSSCQFALAGDWTHWRGPEQNGVSRDRGLINNWSLDGTNVLWTSPIGGRATPIVLRGRVYLNCRTSDDASDPAKRIHVREQVVCWDAQTGEVLWRDQFNVFQTDISAERVGWASMAGDAETGNVYMHSVSGLFRCYSGDGQLIWEHSLLEEYGKISGYGGRTQTPIVDEDRVIISFLAINWGETGAPPPKQYYYGFDKRTGELLWVSAPGGPPYDTNYSVPIIKVIGGVRMLIGGNSDGRCYAIQSRNGQPLWGFRLSERGINVSPVTDGKLVYIAHGEENIDNLAFGRVQCIDGTERGDITETHGIWRVDGIEARFSGLLVHDGILYVMADDGVLYAFDSQTGDKLWHHVLGTVGKGSPVWADGKLYVTELHGNVYILKPSRDGCETLSHVFVPSATGAGYDDIHASLAIADSRLFLVTRDRTLCLGSKQPAPPSDPIPALPDEVPADDRIAQVQLVPFEATTVAGQPVEYDLRAFDRNGRFIRSVNPTLEGATGLSGALLEGHKLTPADRSHDQAGTVAAKHGDLKATARVRVFPSLPWHWDFEGFAESQVPLTWIRASGKLRPVQVDGSTAMVMRPGVGRPSSYIWIGPTTMTGYTMQGDVMARQQRRRRSNVGLTAQRYNLILKGNSSRLEIQSWAPQLRMAREIPFRWDPDTWYTMKLRVDLEDDEACVRGKVWPQEAPEPDSWTIEAVDPHPNRQGSPGLYVYSLAESYFDNVRVSRTEVNDE